jgi:hypothetical protein
MKYLVHIRESYGTLTTEDKIIDGRVYKFVPSGYIQGGHAHGEVKMVPDDDAYPTCGPEFLALGDLINVS